MINLNVIMSICSLIGTVSTIFFAYLAFRRSEKEEQKTDGKTEGVMFSDIGYIKACVDRVEKNLNKVDEGHRNIAERLAKVEVSLTNVIKRVDEYGM